MFLDLVMGRKNQVGLTLSPQAVAVLDELAQQTELSRAEVVEAIANAELVLNAAAPQWSFYLTAGESQTLVEAVPVPAPKETAAPAAAPQPTTPAAPAAPQSTSPVNADPVADAVQQLRQEKADLQTQLQQSQSQVQQLQHRQQTPSPPASQSADPLIAAVNHRAASLREELTQLKAAYAELKHQHQQQVAENDRLQQALAQAQPVATIGEAQLNRWQYKTFSR